MLAALAAYVACYQGADVCYSQLEHPARDIMLLLRGI